MLFNVIPFILYLLFVIIIIFSKNKYHMIFSFITITILLYYLLQIENIKNITTKINMDLIFFLIIIFIMVIYIFITKKNQTKKNIINEINENSEKTVIPLDIYQTWHTKELPPKMKECVEKLKKDNPEFRHHLYDIEDCRKFIGENFEEDVLNAYDSLIPLAYKADLWRYCVLYKYGGVYLDIKMTCVNGFKFIDYVDDEYFVLEKPLNYSNKLKKMKNADEQMTKFMCNPNYLNEFESFIDKNYWVEYNFGIWNGLIICKKNNPILLECIQQIVKNVKNKYYGKIDISPTGPIVLGKFYFKKYGIDYNSFTLGYCIDDYKIIDFKKKKIIISRYDEYREEQSKYSNIESYSVLWKKKYIYL